jgi:hypothetical protein
MLAGGVVEGSGDGGDDRSAYPSSTPKAAATTALQATTMRRHFVTYYAPR